MRIPAFLTMLLMIIVLFPATSCYADTDPPAPDPSCVRDGDPAFDDVWDLCPGGKSRCYRWNGYFGVGFWGSCDSVGDAATEPCSWDEGAGLWRCEERLILCTRESCS